MEQLRKVNSLLKTGVYLRLKLITMIKVNEQGFRCQYPSDGNVLTDGENVYESVTLGMNAEPLQEITKPLDIEV